MGAVLKVVVHCHGEIDSCLLNLDDLANATKIEAGTAFEEPSMAVQA